MYLKRDKIKKYQLLLLICFLFTPLTDGAVDSQDEQVISWRQNVQPYSQEQKSLFKTSQMAIQAIPASSISGGLSHLNKLRILTGMTAFSENILLNQSAFNHSYYHILNDTMGHGEVENTPGFTGASPTDRANFVGYLSTVGENISAGNSDVINSIDLLFSAIYHRFGFLDFAYDEIGLGTSSSATYAYENSYVYNMGNNDINQLCAGESFTGVGSYYWGVCADVNFRIELNTYESALDFNKIANPALVVWPFENQSDSLPVFFEESPDPLPDCSVSGYLQEFRKSEA